MDFLDGMGVGGGGMRWGDKDVVARVGGERQKFEIRDIVSPTHVSLMEIKMSQRSEKFEAHAENVRGMVMIAVVM